MQASQLAAQLAAAQSSSQQLRQRCTQLEAKVGWLKMLRWRVLLATRWT